MHHYSKNIGKLQSLFTFPQVFQDDSSISDFQKNVKCKGIAILLANAELATPELNRETIITLLKGDVGWPKIDGSICRMKTDVAIEVFEELGALSFHADYCSVHPRINSVHEEKILCGSLKAFYDALKMIQNIIYGAEDFVGPHFQINKDHAAKLIQKESINIDLDNLPELVCNEDKYQIKLCHFGYKNLLSEYLWQELNKLDVNSESVTDINFEPNETLTEEKKAAFKKWVLIARVYSDCYFWDINLNYIDKRRKAFFLKQVLHLIEKDPSLKSSQSTLENQWRCESHFEQMLIQRDITITIPIKPSEPGETKIDNVLPTVFTLDEVIEKFVDRKCEVSISNLEFVHEWLTHTERQFPTSGYGIYYGILRKIAENDIYVNGQSIHSYGKLDRLLSLSNERPEIRHILFNLLPTNGSLNYLLYLLSKIETTSTAVYLFTVASTHGGLKTDNPDPLSKLSFSIVCDEFLDVGFQNPHNKLPDSDIVDLLICLARNSIHETFKGEPNVRKDCLDILLGRFSLDQVSYFSETLLFKIRTDSTHYPNRLSVWKYYLLFWLLGKCQDLGVLAVENLAENVQLLILDLYNKAFKANIDSPDFPFGACNMFDHLPWWRINDNYVPDFLSLVSKPANWILKLDSENSIGHNNKRIIRNYFQLVLCLFSKGRSDDCNNQITRKIVSLLETCGFSEEPNKYIGMFDYESEHDYDLWRKLTFFIDDVGDNIFHRIIDLLKSGIPINRILEIYKNTNKESRKAILIKHIKSIPQDSLGKLGLRSIEESLNIACQTGQLDLAKAMLEKGLFIINDEKNFLRRKQNSYFFSQIQNSWISYEFKVNLLIISNDTSLSTNEKLKLLREQENPFKSATLHTPKHNLLKGCDEFQRTMLALILFKEKPETAYQYFDCLYKENKNIQHSGNRFASKLSFLDKNNSENKKYQHALSEWLETTEHISIQKIETSFIQNWFHCLLKLDDHKKIAELWIKLSEQQQNAIEIATSYCQSLKRQGENHSAKLIFDRLKKHHDIKNLGEEAEKLLLEMENLIINGHEPLSIAVLSKIIAEKPKSIDELRRSYQEIYFKNLSDIVSIIRGEDITIEHFLYNQINSIIRELQLRKNNLNTFSNNKNGTSHRIIKEDLINDWVTSLFDHKHSEMGLSCRDQKRGGQSASKANPGEIDFFICDKNNDRIAIMEAFRLFSNDTTVINDHLDKIAGYDQECLSPVFMLAYCNVKDFPTLCVNYQNDTFKREYNGFNKSHSKSEFIKAINDSGTRKIYKEIRYRGSQPITIYHFLINLKFST